MYSSYGAWSIFNFRETTWESSSDDHKVMFPIGANTIATLDIFGVYRRLPLVNGEVRCNEKEHEYKCYAACRIKYIQGRCNCTPIMVNMQLIPTVNSIRVHYYVRVKWRVIESKT